MTALQIMFFLLACSSQMDPSTDKEKMKRATYVIQCELLAEVLKSIEKNETNYQEREHLVYRALSIACSPSNLLQTFLES